MLALVPDCRCGAELRAFAVDLQAFSHDFEFSFQLLSASLQYEVQPQEGLTGFRCIWCSEDNPVVGLKALRACSVYVATCGSIDRSKR